jgi:hypothetical protein
MLPAPYPFFAVADLGGPHHITRGPLVHSLSQEEGRRVFDRLNRADRGDSRTPIRIA